MYRSIITAVALLGIASAPAFAATATKAPVTQPTSSLSQSVKPAKVATKMPAKSAHIAHKGKTQRAAKLEGKVKPISAKPAG